MKRRRRTSNCPPSFDYSRSDPFGSYTGLTKDNDKPVQDADDL